MNITNANKLAFFHKIGYHPHEGQIPLHLSSSRFKTIIAASRFGKTMFAAHEIIAEAMEPVKGKVIWCVAPTYDLADKVFRIVMDTMVYQLGLETTHKSDKDRIIQFKWGVTVQGKSTHIKESLLGEGVDVMVVDEAARIPSSIWQKFLRQRLSNKLGRGIFISSPCGTDGWFVDNYRRGMEGTDPLYKSWQCPLWLNNLFPKEEIEQMSRELPPEVFDQEAGAKLVPPGGRVYKQWDEAVHVSEEAEFDPAVPFDIAVDFGARNATACLFIQKAGVDKYNIFDEFYEAGQDSMYCAARIKTKCDKYMQQTGQTTVRFIHDPSGKDESSIYKKFMPYLSKEKANNDIVPGINTVKYGLVVPEESPRPRVLTHPRCVKHTWEMGAYHYSERIISEIPLSVNDHSCDARRYYFHTIDPMCLNKPNIENFSTDNIPNYLSNMEDYQNAKENFYNESYVSLEEVNRI